MTFAGRTTNTDTTHIPAYSTTIPASAATALVSAVTNGIECANVSLVLRLVAVLRV